MNSKKKYGHHEMPIDEIVRSIRGIINTHGKDKNRDNEDILELTEIFEHNQLKENEEEDLQELISPGVANDVKEKINNFNKKATEPLEDSDKYCSDVSAEKLLMQLLIPELKVWLDKNLPEIIERVTTKELRRLINKKNN